MKPRNPRVRTLLVTLTALAVILGGLVGSYYFYIQANTEYLDARNKRVLNRMRKNMVERNQIYTTNVRTTTAELLADLRQKVQALINERLEADFQRRREQRIEEVKANFDPKVARQNLEVVQQKVAYQMAPAPKLDNPALIEIVPEDRVFRILPSANLPIQEITFDEFQERYSERINLSFSLALYEGNEQASAQNDPGKEAKLQAKDTTFAYNQYEISYRLLTEVASRQRRGRSSSAKQKYEIRLTLDMQTFMEPLLRSDVFDEFLILRDTSTSPPVNLNNVVFATLEDKRVAAAVQRLLPKLTELVPDSSTIREIDQLPYRLYSQSIQFQGEEVVVCGLVTNQHFNRQRQRVSTVLILLISLLVFVVLLAFPVLKMALMGPYERMRLDDLLLSSVTAILGTSLIALLLIDLYGYNGPDRMRRRRQLMSLSNNIETRLTQDIQGLYRQLGAYDSTDICDRLRRTNLLAMPDTTALFPQEFPFYQNIFWVTPDQRLAQQWSISNEEVPLVSVAGRSYYEDLMNGDSWQLPGDSTGLGRFTLASIRTRTNGDLAVVLARRSQRKLMPVSTEADTLQGAACEDRQDLIDCDIIMASADLPSVVRPVLPPGFGFAVISPEGDVLFHSDPTRSLQENFLEEVNLPALQAAMFSRSPLYDRGTYLGSEYDFFLQPVDQLPMFLVTFRRRGFYQNTHAQIISLTFLLTLATFLSGVLFVGIIIAFSPRNPVIKHDQFAFDWLRPFHRHRRRYRELVVNNLYALVLAGIFTPSGTHPLAALSIIASSYVFTFLLVFLRLNKNAHQQFMWREYQRIAWLVITLLIAGNLAMYTALEDTDYRNVLLYELLQSVVLIGVIGRIFADSQARRTGWIRRLYDGYANVEQRVLERIPWLDQSLQQFWEVLNAQRSYRLFLTTWLVILGVFPVVKFYEIAYNRETRLQVRFSQIEMAEDLVARRAALRAQYRFLPLPESMVNQYLQANSYTGSYFNTSLDLQPSGFTTNEWQDAWLQLPDSLTAELVPKRYQFYDSLLSAIRPRYDELTLRTRQINTRGSANEQWRWQVGDGDRHWLYFFYNDGFRLRTELPFYHFPVLSVKKLVTEKNASLILFYVLLGGFFILMYSLLRFMVQQLFGRSALRIPSPDPIVAKRTLLDSEESIFLVVPLRAVEQDYLSVIDLKLADVLESHYLAVPDRSRYYFRLNEEKDLTRLRALIARTPVPTDPPVPLNTDRGPEDIFAQNTYILNDLPLLILDDFESIEESAEACQERLALIEELLDYGIQLIVISTEAPMRVQQHFARLMAGGDGDDQEPERLRLIAYLSRLLSGFSKIDYPMEHWEIFDYPQDALSFIRNKHVFLHVTSPAVLGQGQRTLRTLQVKVEGRRTPTIRKTGRDTNILVIDETYNEILLDDRLETIHRWLEFEEERQMEHQITIVSTITPLQIADIYYRSGCEPEELREKLRSWERVLSLFYKGIVSDDPRRVPPEERVADLIRRECVHGPFLQSIQDELLDQLKEYKDLSKGDRELKEDIILRIENRAHLYYQSLWAACTKEERYLIFDLAQDGLINASNLTSIASLIRKGIFIQTPDTLVIMNKSFRNFVLTVVQPVDALRMELEIESQDLWRRLRTPISVILFALGAFVFYTQREILNETLAFVTGVAALIPTLSRVLEAVTEVNPGKLTGIWPFRRKEKEGGDS